MSAPYPVPEKENVTILVILLPTLWALLWVGSHAPLWQALFAAFVFSQLHNTLFSVLHEAVHGVFSSDARRNRFYGRVCASVFPTSFTLQRIAHLGHHRRNRTDEDLYDYYLPTQSRVLRNVWLYGGNLMGLYWFCLPLGASIYLLAPWMFRSQWFRKGPAQWLGFGPHVQEISEHPWYIIWGECAAGAVYQVLIWKALHLTLHGWLLCHWMFALHWSALQYVDHAWSERDVLEGAWNLRVSAIARRLALNYHLHRAHHQSPEVPWVYLPSLVDPRVRQPTFWSIYFSLWGGTRPAPPMGAPAGIMNVGTLKGIRSLLPPTFRSLPR